MKTDVHILNDITITEIISEELLIKETQDAVDLMAECVFNGSDKIILHEKNIIADFFDLKTRIAGDILQKFSNYKVRLAVVGDFSKYTSKSLRDFILESNKHGQVNFVNSTEEAIERLKK